MEERLVRIAAGPERDAYLPFLRLADDAQSLILGYYQAGELFSFEIDAEVIGTVLVLGEGATREVKSLAVAGHHQGQGLGQRMLRAVIREMRASGVRRLELKTGNCGIGEIAFYQKLGFRLLRIERDAFTPETGYPEPIYENGIRLRDAVWFDLPLTTS